MTGCLTTARPTCPADGHAINLLRQELAMSLLDAANVTARMSEAEIDQVERSRSPVELAAVVYQAQLRAARRIADPEQRRIAISAARADAARNARLIADRVPLDAPQIESQDKPRHSPRAVRVYPTPPTGATDA